MMATDALPQGFGMPGFGALPSPPDPRDYRAKDWLAKGVRPLRYGPPRPMPVKNQGAFQCCVGEALALALSCFGQRAGGAIQEHASEYVYHRRRHPSQAKGAGMYARYALADLCEGGAPPLAHLREYVEYTTPERQAEAAALDALAGPHRAQAYYGCATDSEACDAIFQTGAAILCIDVKLSFVLNFGRRVLPQVSASDPSLGYHAVCAIGYDETGILIQNSYGTEWGDGGLAVVPYGYAGIAERWGITDRPAPWRTVKLRVGSTDMYVDGEMRGLDVGPQIIGNRSMCVLRAPLEAMGARVDYNDATRNIVIVQGDNILRLVVDSPVMTANGREQTLEAPPMIVGDGRVLAPVRAPFEALGVNVEYVNGTQEIILRQKGA
jgi:hypothetical protein